MDKKLPSKFLIFRKSVFYFVLKNTTSKTMGQKYATRKYRVNTFSLKSDRNVFDQKLFKTSKEKKLLVAVTKFSIRKYLAMLKCFEKLF